MNQKRYKVKSLLTNFHKYPFFSSSGSLSNLLKNRKEKFVAEHKAVLDKWKQTDRFIRQRLPDQSFNAATLQKELSSLNAMV